MGRTRTQHYSRTSETENAPPLSLPPSPLPAASEGDHGDPGEEEGGAGDGEDQREEGGRVDHQRAALLAAAVTAQRRYGVGTAAIAVSAIVILVIVATVAMVDGRQ